jgi:hypothetical protein
VVTTVNDASARTTLAQMGIRRFIHRDHDYFNNLIWRAGRHSVVRSIEFSTPPYEAGWWNYATNDHRDTTITGNGGGKWYAYHIDSRSRFSWHPNFQRLLIDGTTEPLFIYGFNPERANYDYDGADRYDRYQSLARNAKNVFIFGMKTEQTNSIGIDNCDNVAVFGLGGSSQVKIWNDSTNILLANMCPQSTGTAYNVQETYGGATVSVDRTHVVTLFKRGQTTLPTPPALPRPPSVFWLTR